MRFTVVTIFPEMFASVLEASILGRARTAGLIEVDFVDPRDFTTDRHRTVDDAPYGGGPGMVMKVEPLVAAIESVTANGGEAPHRVLLTPTGAPLEQRRVRALAGRGHLVLVCGRYEGIDERVSELAIDEEISLGDFVLTGGELAAMTLIDAVARYVPGVLGEAASTDEESFSAALLEYPQYTRPARFRDREVPAVLTSGDHERIRRWRRARSLERTARRRPDLWARHRLGDEDRTLWAAMPELHVAARTWVALVHHPVHDRTGDVVTTAVTNFDVHDIARSAATYGLAGYLLITPVAAQRDKVDRILQVWAGEDARGGDYRLEALGRVRTAASLPEAIAAIGGDPRVVLTTADSDRFEGLPRVSPEDLVAAARDQPQRPVLLVLGTGWGLTEETKSLADQVLEPVGGRPAFNHLSVRSAAAALLDRLFGDRGR
jgi:tRNA (guanine37-N1)-methyltransferase